MSENFVVELESEVEDENSSTTFLELLAIQAMMNPAKGEDQEPEFEWSGKLEEL